MEFVLTYLAIAAITTVCLVILIITAGVMVVSATRSRIELEAMLLLDDSETPGASWHPSENV